MSTLTSPRLSPRPNSCNDLYKLSQKSPRLNESEKYEQSKILTNAAMNILNKLVLEAEDKPRTLLPSIFNKFGSISADHQYSPRLKKEVPNISRKTSSASCNDLANLSSKYVSTARDSHVTCGWLPRLEDDDVILANEEPVMLATVVELMTMIGQPEEKASNKSTLPHSQRSTKSSSQTPATPKKEEKPQSQPPPQDAFDFSNALEMMNILGDYDGEDTNISFDDLEFMLQYDKYQGDLTTFGNVSSSFDFEGEGVETQREREEAQREGEGGGGGGGPLHMRVLGTVV